MQTGLMLQFPTMITVVLNIPPTHTIICKAVDEV